MVDFPGFPHVLEIFPKVTATSNLSIWLQVIADLFIFMEYSKARGKHDGRFTQIRLWVQFVLGKLACLVLGIDAFLFKVRIAYRTGASFHGGRRLGDSLKSVSY